MLLFVAETSIQMRLLIIEDFFLLKNKAPVDATVTVIDEDITYKGKLLLLGGHLIIHQIFATH